LTGGDIHPCPPPLGTPLLACVIAASRPVNKNVNTDAVITAKPSTDRVGRS